MLLFSSRLMTLAATAIQIIAFAHPVNAETWAAQCPYTDAGAAPVVHADTQDKASKRAVQACKKLHPDKICCEGPATSIVDNTTIFVTSCCVDRKNNKRCQTIVGSRDDDASRNAAFSKTKNDMMAANLPIDECNIESVYDITTGKELDR
ncbi:MAG: hypothetical protein J0I92_04460 [Phyllobacterium sp.]|nr:hypothetical protein [Phyllobacterium sp.]